MWSRNHVLILLLFFFFKAFRPKCISVLTEDKLVLFGSVCLPFHLFTSLRRRLSPSALLLRSLILLPSVNSRLCLPPFASLDAWKRIDSSFFSAIHSPPLLHFHSVQSAGSNTNQRNNPSLPMKLSCNLSAPSSLAYSAALNWNGWTVSNGWAVHGVMVGSIGRLSTLFWIWQMRLILCIVYMCNVLQLLDRSFRITTLWTASWFFLFPFDIWLWRKWKKWVCTIYK